MGFEIYPLIDVFRAITDMSNLLEPRYSVSINIECLEENRKRNHDFFFKPENFFFAFFFSSVKDALK